MKNILIVLLFFSVTLSVYSQTGTSTSSKSKTKQIIYKRNVNTSVVRLLPNLQIINQEFNDQNNNKIIDAEENAIIKFNVQNKGEGEAQQVNIKISLLNGPIQGLDYTPLQSIGVIYPTETKEISIPLTGRLDIVNGTAKFKIETIEKNGLDAYPFEMEIQTREFKKPEIVIADAVFSTEGGGKIKLNSPINLKVLIQNIGMGDAKNVNAEFFLENSDCIMLDADKYNIGFLKVGETKELNFIFTATRRYAFDKIPVTVALSEYYGKYGDKKSVSVGLEENLVGNNAVVINGLETEKKSIERASFTSEVDKNIPLNPLKYPGRIALIVGNEDYSHQQRNLNSEVNVKYAGNDARIFSEYAKMTLGVKDENLFLLIDATSGEMQQNVEVVSKLASRIGPEAEIIFFYAGHGLPDETTKTPYLIPVDVTGTNLNAALKLSEICKKLGESGSRKVSIFLDACFSGGGREAGLLAARGVKIKPREESLSGNVVVFTASSGEQSALPFKEKQHGMFTYFLLKKIQESSGDVTYKDLSDYLSKNVAIESLRTNAKEQDPVINISPIIGSLWQSWKIN
jgi:hypothetical protein